MSVLSILRPLLQKYNFLGKELTVTPEIIYRNTPELEKFKNKKILVIGGGPTTNWYNWDPDKYDFVFSCNHFFLNEKINKIKIDLAMITNEVDLAGEKFLEYIKTNNTTLVFEDYNSNINNIVRLNEQINKLNIEGNNEKNILNNRCSFELGNDVSICISS